MLEELNKETLEEKLERLIKEREEIAYLRSKTSHQSEQDLYDKDLETYDRTIAGLKEKIINKE